MIPSINLEGFPVITYINNNHSIELLESNEKSNSLIWKPLLRPKPVLVLVADSGSLIHWDLSTQRCLNRITIPDLHFTCVDFSKDSRLLAAGTQESAIEVIDEVTKSSLMTLRPAASGFIGHSLKISSLKFDPDNPNILVSASSDPLIQIWDLRNRVAVRALNVEDMQPEALDVRDNSFLTCTNSPQPQAQVFDVGTCDLIASVKVNDRVKTCMFSKSDKGLNILARTENGASLINTTDDHNYFIGFDGDSNYWAMDFAWNSLDFVVLDGIDLRIVGFK
jgi:WD40 repeat protein